jgi:hypothetical protein
VNISRLNLRSEKFDDDDDDDDDYDDDNNNNNNNNNNLVMLTLQIKALFFFEISGTTNPAIQRHIPEDSKASAALL